MATKVRAWALLLGLLGFSVAAWGDADPAFLPLAARYQETRATGKDQPHRSGWQFVRSANAIELGRGPYVERWERDERGEVSLERVFHDARKRVAYTAGELRTEGRALSWDVLNTLIDEKVLATLRPVGSTRYLGRPALRYRGRLGGQAIEVVWLPRERLPGRVWRQEGRQSWDLMLKELRAEPAVDWPRAELPPGNGYEFIDGADLGDREYDPFVRRLLAVDERGGRQHAH